MADTSEHKTEHIQKTLELNINRGTVAVAKYMAECGLEGGVSLDRDKAAAIGIPDGTPEDRNRKYEIGPRISYGGMGAIFRAKDLNCRRTVAMKVMLPSKETNQAKYLRFIEEAQVTSQLEHPNIVPLHELGVDAAGNVFYTMKLVHGVTLKQILKEIAEGNRLTIERYPLTQLLTVLLKVCDAVAFAHSKFVIHRDLKPENIMVGEYGEVLVMDWGLAKVISLDKAQRGQQDSGRYSPPGRSGGGGDANLKSDERRTRAERRASDTQPIESPRSVIGDEALKTVEGLAVGTPAFMAPEQASGRVSELDLRTDIYMLGGILYNILTLHPPVEGKTVDETLVKVIRGEIEPPLNFNQTPISKLPPSKLKSKPRIVSRSELKKAATVALQQMHDHEHETELPPLPQLPGGRVPQALSAVAMKALSPRPDQRYQNVLDFQRDIDAFLSGFATVAEQAGLWKQLLLLVMRHKALFSMALGVVILLTTAITVSLRKVASERDAALKSEQEAEAVQKKLLDVSVKAAPEFVTKSKKLMDSKQWDSAMAAVNLALALNPSLGEAWLDKGRLHLGNGDYEDALAAFRKAREYPQNVSVGPVEMADYIKITEQAAAAASKQKQVEKIHQAVASLLEERLNDNLMAGRLYGLAKNEVKQYELQAKAAFNALVRVNTGLKLTDIQVQSVPKPSGDGIAGYQVVCHSKALVDLSPLKGYPLAVYGFDFAGTGVRDIAPLQGLQLTALNIMRTEVADLKPLRGMNLKELYVGGTGLAMPVNDITPLSNMPLTVLHLCNTQVSSIAVLSGMPLVYLKLFDNPNVTDLSYLSTCKSLVELGIPTSALDRDIDYLRQLPALAVLATTESEWQNKQSPAEFWRRRTANNKAK